MDSRVKVCTSCGETKPATTEFFTLHKRGKYGFHPTCKICRRMYYEGNRDRETLRARKFYKDNGEYVRERMRLYAEINRDSVLRRNRLYQAAHRLKSGEYGRTYYIKNKGAMNARAKAWRQSHPEMEKAYSHAKRARKKAATGTHTASDIRHQYAAQRGRCYYCQEETGSKYHVEHVIPLSRGGSNGPENIVISCPKCNLEKGAKMPHEWSKGGRLL